ncbi:MAG TPA: phage tail protein [Candidatus Saccharibacteria bacterium]|nr:phage tail protein [Candidatus Saccharibacteria bacterium]
MNDASNVSFGKPKATGAVFVAPAGTTLPTNATSALDAAFKGLGYVSEDGLVNSVETDTENVNAWGGDLVLVGQTTFMETFMVNLIETNPEALKVYYGEDNVTVSGENITITQNSAQLPNVSVVFEIVLTGGRIKRIVVPNAQIVDRSGEITYVDGEPIAYPALFQAYPDTDGNSHTEYIAVIAS